MYIFHLCVCTRTHARARDDSKMLILSGPCFSAAVLGSQQIEGSAETSHKPPASHVYPPHHLYPTSEWDTYETDEPTRTHRHHPRSTVYSLCFVLSTLCVWTKAQWLCPPLRCADWLPPQIFCARTICSPRPQPWATVHLFTTATVSPFPECRAVGIGSTLPTAFAQPFQLASFTNHTHLRLCQVFSCFDNAFVSC